MVNEQKGYAWRIARKMPFWGSSHLDNICRIFEVDLRGGMATQLALLDEPGRMRLGEYTALHLVHPLARNEAKISSLLVSRDTPGALRNVAPAGGGGNAVALSSWSASIADSLGKVEVYLLTGNPPWMVVHLCLEQT